MSGIGQVVRGPSGLVNFGVAVHQWPQHLLREQEGRGRSILCGRSRRLTLNFAEKSREGTTYKSVNCINIYVCWLSSTLTAKLSRSTLNPKGDCVGQLYAMRCTLCSVKVMPLLSDASDMYSHSTLSCCLVRNAFRTRRQPL